MGNLGQEAYFGDSTSLYRLSEALRRTSGELQNMRHDLKREVTGLVPANWNGDAASAFQEHWRQRSESIDKTAELARMASTTLATLAGALASAKQLFQSAEAAAPVAGCRIDGADGAFVVEPATGVNAGWLQGMVSAAVMKAKEARLQATWELRDIQADANPFLKWYAMVGLRSYGGLAQMAIGAGGLTAELSPVRAATDTWGWLKAAGSAVASGAETVGTAAWQLLEASGENNEEVIRGDPQGYWDRLEAKRRDPMRTQGMDIVDGAGEVLVPGVPFVAARLATKAVNQAAVVSRLVAARRAAAGYLTNVSGARGAAFEAASAKTLAQEGVASADLNTMKKFYRGDNSYLADKATSVGFTSDKAYRDVSALDEEFRELFKSDKTDIAAQEIRKPENAEWVREAQKSGAWPRNLSPDASVADISRNIREEGILRVPDDRVGPLRALVRGKIEGPPGQPQLGLFENYGLPANPTPEQVNRVLDRIRGGGLSNQQLDWVVPPPMTVGPIDPMREPALPSMPAPSVPMPDPAVPPMTQSVWPGVTESPAPR
jgi:uncharacterized protein YukE